jgi:hypothetical protein
MSTSFPHVQEDIAISPVRSTGKGDILFVVVAMVVAMVCIAPRRGAGVRVPHAILRLDMAGRDRAWFQGPRLILVMTF